MSKPDFDAWVAEAQTKFARADQDELQVAGVSGPAKPAN